MLVKKVSRVQLHFYANYCTHRLARNNILPPLKHFNVYMPLSKRQNHNMSMFRHVHRNPNRILNYMHTAFASSLLFGRMFGKLILTPLPELTLEHDLLVDFDFDFDFFDCDTFPPL